MCLKPRWHVPVQNLVKYPPGPKNISSASLQHKNITYFYALTPVNEFRNQEETKPVEARIASTKPRNTSLTLFYAQKISWL